MSTSMVFEAVLVKKLFWRHCDENIPIANYEYLHGTRKC